MKTKTTTPCEICGKHHRGLRSLACLRKSARTPGTVVYQARLEAQGQGRLIE